MTAGVDAMFTKNSKVLLAWRVRQSRRFLIGLKQLPEDGIVQHVR